jgi:hypothetical protein
MHIDLNAGILFTLLLVNLNQSAKNNLAPGSEVVINIIKLDSGA